MKTGDKNKGMDGWIHHPQTGDVRTKYCSIVRIEKLRLVACLLLAYKMSIKDVLHVK